MTKKSLIRRLWTAAEKEQLRKLYPDTATIEIAHLLGRPLDNVYGKAFRLGLKKSAQYLAGPHACRLRRGDNVGAAHRFQKGNVPFNKGIKGVIYEGCKATQFKPGQRPHTYVPVGTVVMATDGYLKIKVGEPKDWRWLHRLNWEKAHGPIPRGWVLVFRDGNRRNCAVENLELIDRLELMRRNSIHRYPPALKQVIRLAGKLRRTIEASHEKQD